MKATEQYFPVVLFIMLYKVVLTFGSVDEILKCDHSNESHWWYCRIFMPYCLLAVRGGSTFQLWMKFYSVTVLLFFENIKCDLGFHMNFWPPQE